MDREGRKTGRRELTHGTRETERMGEKGWNGCRSSCRGTSLRGGFPHGSGNDDDSRRDMRQTHCAAKPNAARCDGRCSALRWTMHRTASFHPNHSHEARRTQQPPQQPPIGLQRQRLSYPSMPSESCLLPQKDTCCAGFSGPPDRLPKGIQGTQKQDGASQEAERRKMCDRTERPKGLNEGNRTTGRSGHRSRKKKDVQKDGASQRKERRKQDDRTERAKRPNEERRATGRSGPKD